MEERLVELYSFPAELLVWMDSRKGEVIAFSLVPTGEPTMLQWIVPNPWSHK